MSWIILPWQRKSLFDKVHAWMCWAILAYSLLMIAVDWVPPEPLFVTLVVFSAMTVIAMLQGYRISRKTYQRIKRVDSAMKESRPLSTLPPEDQEEIAISNAKYMLSRKDR